ncbi:MULTISPECIES: hypothetical protein [Xanthobacter]|uniref:hypothetical protein n=1 Tax=Xanthobacter TaxID=279 RepID=UPI001F335018|nr:MULTISPECIES: hypothetical protein [unclassified Xanthobacter]
MWVVVFLVVNALSGPDVRVVKEAAYSTEDACKASITRNVPAKLDAKAKAEFEQGYRRYVCVRVGDLDVLTKAK